MRSNPPRHVVSSLIILMSLSPAKLCSAEPASGIPVVVQQCDGMNITLIPRGGEYISYFSDVDGYTVLRDLDGDGCTYYAERLEDGTLGFPGGYLVGSGLLDPDEVGIPRSLLPSIQAQRDDCEKNNLLCADQRPWFSGADNRNLAQAEDRDGRSTTATTGNRRLGKMGTPRRDGVLEPEQQNWPDIVGELKNLVVMLRFSDHADRVLPTSEDMEVMCNHEGPHPLAPTGSVRDGFLKSSYGKLDVTSTVYDYIDLPETEAYYANGNSGTDCTFHEALTYSLDQLEADPGFNFSDFDRNGDGWIDAIGFVFSGYSASNMEVDQYGAPHTDRIWPHKYAFCTGPWLSKKSWVQVNRYHCSSAVWSYEGNELNHLGSMMHETGHFLGIPDLYDTTDRDNYLFADAGYGIGNYGLMANNWGFDNTQLYPPHMTAWTRIQLGWDTPTVITEPGTYTIAAAELQADDEDDTDDPKIYKIEVGYPEGEYLLIENRQPLHFDADMPQGGLVIYHIDDRAEFSRQGWPGQDELDDEGGVKWPQNGKHYRVALLSPDGNYDLELDRNRGDEFDVFHSDGVDEIGPSSKDDTDGPYPNTDSYQKGDVRKTGHRIYDIGPSGSVMTFKYELQTSDQTSGGTEPEGEAGAETGELDPGTADGKEVRLCNLISERECFRACKKKVSKCNKTCKKKCRKKCCGKD